MMSLEGAKIRFETLSHESHSDISTSFENDEKKNKECKMQTGKLRMLVVKYAL